FGDHRGHQASMEYAKLCMSMRLATPAIRHAIADGSPGGCGLSTGRGGRQAWHRALRDDLWLRCAGESWRACRRRAVPAVRRERLAAVREWFEVGLPRVLLHRAVL